MPARIGAARLALLGAAIAAAISWILSSGVWTDAAPWDDTQNWKDAA